MNLTTNRSLPMAERIAHALAERIVAGELPPGAPLRQDRVAEEFGVSHVPAREAFQMLRALGLAVSEPRRGVRVAPMEAADRREVMEMRAALELLAFRYAVVRMNPARIAAIEAAVHAGERAASVAEWECANRDFHAAIVAPCRMQRLLTTLDQLRLAHSRIVIAMDRSASWQPRSNHEHRQILAAITARDHNRATALLTRHLQGLELPNNDPA